MKTAAPGRRMMSIPTMPATSQGQLKRAPRGGKAADTASDGTA